MKDYASMSDFEINEAVGKFVYPPHLCVSGRACLYAKDDIWTEFNPCNNPADAWPIIEKNRIGLSPSDDIWHAYSADEDFVCSINRPLRAAMVVFLMMKESE